LPEPKWLRNSIQAPNTIITHISTHKHQQIAPAKKTVQLTGCYGGHMGGDCIGTMLPNKIKQTVSILHWSQYTGEFGSAVHSIFKMLCNAMSNCQWFPLPASILPNSSLTYAVPACGITGIGMRAMAQSLPGKLILTLIGNMLLI
jgi:hypothetical protein